MGRPKNAITIATDNEIIDNDKILEETIEPSYMVYDIRTAKIDLLPVSQIDNNFHKYL